MSKKINKIKNKVADIYYKSYEEILEVSAILKILEYACEDSANNLTIHDASLAISVIRQKMHMLENHIDDLSLI